ncbi:unnamed protein product, partial [Prorocentrum cordatum]
ERLGACRQRRAWERLGAPGSPKTGAADDAGQARGVAAGARRERRQLLLRLAGSVRASSASRLSTAQGPGGAAAAGACPDCSPCHDLERVALLRGKGPSGAEASIQVWVESQGREAALARLRARAGPGGALERFAALLGSLCELFGVPCRGRAHIFEEDAQTVAFNHGALFFNFRYFVEEGHEHSWEAAVSFWLVSFAHELAHLETPAHDRRHGRAMEAAQRAVLPDLPKVMRHPWGVAADKSPEPWLLQYESAGVTAVFDVPHSTLLAPVIARAGLSSASPARETTLCEQRCFTRCAKAHLHEQSAASRGASEEHWLGNEAADLAGGRRGCPPFRDGHSAGAAVRVAALAALLAWWAAPAPEPSEAAPPPGRGVRAQALARAKFFWPMRGISPKSSLAAAKARRNAPMSAGVVPLKMKMSSSGLSTPPSFSSTSHPRAGLSLRGLSGGEKKRLSIAVAMLPEPPIVFADEPTSGLDALASLKVLQALKAVADGGMIVLVTVHQPRGAVWELFDRLYLLSEGHLMFTGEASRAASWFKELGYGVPEDGGGGSTSPADWLLDLVTVGFDKGALEHRCCTSLKEVAEASCKFNSSEYMARVNAEVAMACSGAVASSAPWPRGSRGDGSPGRVGAHV